MIKDLENWQNKMPTHESAVTRRRRRRRRIRWKYYPHFD